MEVESTDDTHVKIIIQNTGLTSSARLPPPFYEDFSTAKLRTWAGRPKALTNLSGFKTLTMKGWSNPDILKITGYP